MNNRQNWYIIAYDVRSPKRLQKIHRLLRSCAYALQNSVFAWYGTIAQLQTLQSKLLKISNLKIDDIRGYRLPTSAFVSLWGVTPFSQGVTDTGRPPYILFDQANAIVEQWPAIGLDDEVNTMQSLWLNTKLNLQNPFPVSLQLIEL
jgi:CRISPR-associated protein Cas2